MSENQAASSGADSPSKSDEEWTAVSSGTSKRRLVPQATLNRGDFAAKEKEAEEAKKKEKKGA